MLKLTTNKFNTILIFMTQIDYILCIGIIISKDNRLVSHYQFGVKKKRMPNSKVEHVNSLSALNI